MTLFSVSSRLAGAGPRLLIASALLAVIAPAHAEITGSDPGAEIHDTAVEGRNKAIVHDAFEKWREGTYVFAALLAPDVVWTIHGSGPVAGTYRNQDDFVERASRPLTSRLATPVVPRGIAFGISEPESGRNPPEFVLPRAANTEFGPSTSASQS